LTFIERFTKNRYTYLFASLLILLVVQPFLRHDTVLLPIFFFLIMLAVLRTLEIHKGLFRFLMVLAVLSLIVSIITGQELLVKAANQYLALTSVNLLFYIIFLGLTILIIVHRLFTEAEVTGNTIQGGISVYFLMGLFWAFCYQLMLNLDPTSIQLPDQFYDYLELLYFSFTTLTTLGYGDIVPVSEFARNLTVLEAMLGQIFLTVFIARLVGLYIGRKVA